MDCCEVNNRYFQWLYGWMCEGRYHQDISYRKLFMQLHDTEFVYFIKKDQNRAMDGINLRYRFATTSTIDGPVDFITDSIDGPCSVLEMMIALANRCEEDYMDDPAFGDRTVQWFWEMITSLNLGSMIDTRYDKQYVNNVLYKFLHREYDRDGNGGLFRIRNCNVDMRKVEIWYQMCYFLDAFA